jgi:tetratricopeptide (TPR) repeat protein
MYYQFITKDYNLMKKSYTLALKNNIHIMDIYNNLGYYNVFIKNNYDIGVDYYNKAINLGSVHAMNNLGLYYYNIEQNFDNAKKYFEMAIDNNLPEAYNNIGIYYYQIEKNIDIAKLYFIEALCNNINNIESVKNNLSNILRPLERYILYRQNSIDITQDDENEFNNDESILIFKNRLNVFDKFMECNICFVDYTNIPLECTHYVCVSCYPKILMSGKCPICRININS